jgi:hypothetical protein
MRNIHLVLLFVPAVAWAGATASSHRAEHRKGANFYNAPAAIDGNATTAWVVPGESPNRGEWIMLDLPKCTVDKIGMIVGWTFDNDHYLDYPRLKKAKIEVFALDDAQNLLPRGSAIAEFADKPEWQVVDISDLPVGDDLFGGKIRITVVDVYGGRDYPNIAISELRVYLKEFDVDPKLTASSDPVGTNTSDLATDDNPKSFWVTAAEGAGFTLDTSGFGVSTIGLVPGSKNYSRPKTVEVSANDRTLTTTLSDALGIQWVEVPTITGYTGGAFGDIEVKILDTYPGTDPHLAFTEIKVRATSFE